ncbi:MAG: hypothetical protein HY879_17455 [Deltaproteobacteria bacterium]|nr:hypothetical protein [Deltaproteobacteria bacterium]
MMKPKKRMQLVTVLVAMTFFLISTLALAAPPDNFTAKLMIMGMSMPMAKMGSKTRMENMMIGGLVTISMMDVNKSITMNTKNKTYFESAIKEKVPSLYDPKVVIEKKKIGSETIDGHPCIKSDAVFYLKDKPQEKFNAVLWEAQDLGGLPIRNEMVVPESKTKGPGPAKIVTEIKDIKVGAANAGMFEVPKDYQKVSSMNEVMGMGQPGDMKGMQEMMKQMQKMKKMPKEE